LHWKKKQNIRVWGKKQKADVKSNANSTTTVRRRKRGAASNVPLEKGANGRNRRATATTTAKRGAGSGSRSVRVAEYLLEEVVENHNMRILIELEKGLMFADTWVSGMLCNMGLISNTNTMIGWVSVRFVKSKTVIGGFKHLLMQRNNQYK
jgi:hypothetical protein